MKGEAFLGRRRAAGLVAAGLMIFAIPSMAWADETVTISGFAFKPATITVKPGTTVVWVNEDSAPHIVAEKGGKFRSATLNKGNKFSHTFAQAGTVDYVCGIHPSMTGKVVVAP
jgi:plastocyanin